MSSTLVTLLVVGVAVYAFIHRCDLLGICGPIGDILKPGGSSPITSTGNSGDEGDLSAPITGVSAPTAPGGAILPSSGDFNTTIYKATGRKANLTDTGPEGQQIHYASSGKAASSRRLNANNTPFNAIEATIYFQFNGNSCGKPDPEMSIKLWGPTHSNGGCCWCIAVVTASGKVCFGGEGPHPSTTTCQQSAGNVGSLTGKVVGMKAVIWPGNGGAHQEIYLDIGNGQWRLMGTRDGPCGKDKKSTTVSPNQQVEFRIDCKGVSIKGASVNEIVPGSKGGGAPASAIAAKTPIATVKAPPAKKPKSRFVRIAI